MAETTKAERVRELLNERPRTLAELVFHSGAGRRHVLDVLRRLIDGRAAERVETWTPGRPGGRPPVFFRAVSPTPRPGRVDCWLWCSTCGAHRELAGSERESLQKTLQTIARYSHAVSAARLAVECAACRRRRGDLPPIGG